VQVEDDRSRSASTTIEPGTSDTSSAVSVITKSLRVWRCTAMTELTGTRRQSNAMAATWKDARTRSTAKWPRRIAAQRMSKRPDSSTGGR
jgi:hypothetical protein